MKLLRLTTCDFMVYKDYEIGLKFVFRICGINFRTQHLTCSLINYPSRYFFEVTPMRVSTPYHPSAFDHIFFDRWSAAFKVHPGTPYRWGTWTKNFFEPCDIVFDGFFKLFLCLHTFLTGYIQLFLQVLTKTSC